MFHREALAQRPQPQTIGSNQGQMMNGQGNPSTPHGRFPELLEALRTEYEMMYQEFTYLKHHREELDSKLHDIGLIQKILFDLERSHLAMKQQYEDEIKRLKYEIEFLSKGSFTSGTPAPVNFHPLPRLEQEMQSIGASFLAAPVPGIPESANSGYFVKRSSDNEHVRVGGRSDDSSTLSDNPSYFSFIIGDSSAYAKGKKDSSGVYDWLVVYNPKVRKSITVNLLHNFAHDSVVCCLRFNRAATLLATGSNRCVCLYDVKTGNKIATFTDPSSSYSGNGENGDQFFRTISFSPDEKTLISGSEDSLIHFWDIESQKHLFTLSGHEQDIYSVEFYGEGKFLASGSGDKTVKLWDLSTQTCINTLHAGTPDSSKDSGITSLSISPNGKFLAAGSLDRLIRIWELPSGNPVDVIEGHGDSIYSLAFTSDGKHIVSGSLDKTTRVWGFESEDNLKGGKCVYDLNGHKDFVLSVTGSPDGKWLLTGSKDRSVQCWDIETGSVQFMLQGHKNSVIGIVFSSDGKYFATASGDFRARIWSFENVQEDLDMESGSLESVTKQLRKTDESFDEDDEEGSAEDSE